MRKNQNCTGIWNQGCWQSLHIFFVLWKALALLFTFTENVNNRFLEENKNISTALPDQMINYKHEIQMYKLFNQCQPDSEFMHMNFQFNQNPRIKHANFFMRQNYHIGQNILLNRLAHLNDKIERTWLDQSLNTFKIKCKQLFLQINWQHHINYV